jgi:hypothetical protein
MNMDSGIVGNWESGTISNNCETQMGRDEMNSKQRMQYNDLGTRIQDTIHIEYLSKYKPKYLYQYKSGNDKNIENLLNQQIWLSLPLYLNDPFEQEYGVYKDGVLISCFTENYNSLLMWSHYSNGHQGYCVKYNFDEIFNYFQSNLFPMIYSSERFKPTITERGNANEIVNTFIHKALEWKYEREWRVIRLVPVNRQKLTNVVINKGELAKIPKPVEIIIGCHFWNWDRQQKIVKYCKENDIIFSKMYMKDTRYILYKQALPLIIHDPKENDFDKFMKEHFKSEAELERLLEQMEKEQDSVEEHRFEKMKDFL